MHKINVALRILAAVFAVLVIPNPAMADEKPEIFVQMGHSFVITSVAFSPDGRYIASGSADKTVKLWEVSTSREIRTLLGHTSGVSSVVFSPDGRYIVSGSWDKTIKLWDVVTGRELRTLVGHSQAVTSVAFSPDEKYIVSGSGDKTIRFWDASTGREIRTLADHTKEVTTVAFSTDGKYIASGSGDKTIKLWDVATGIEIKTFSGHSNAVTSIAFSPDGRYIVSGSYDIVKLWEVSTARTLKTFTGSQRYQNKEIESVGFSRDGKYVLSASIRSLEENLQIWEVRTGRELKTFKNITINLTAMDFSPDGKTVLTGTMDRSGYNLRLWDLSTGRALRKMGGNVSIGGNSVAFSPDGRYLLTEVPSGTLRLFDLQDAKEVMIFERGEVFSRISALTFTPDGRYVLSGNIDKKTVEVWEVSSGKKLSVFSGHKGDVGSVAISPDGRYALSTDFFLEKANASSKNNIDIYKRFLKLWDVSTGKLVRNLEISLSTEAVDNRYRADLSGAAFSADGKYAVAELDGKLIVWNVLTGKRLKEEKNVVGLPIFSVPGSFRAYAPDGRCALNVGIVNGCISPDGKLYLRPSYLYDERIMELNDISALKGVFNSFDLLKHISTFTGHTNEIRSAVFYPDGRYAASGSHDGTTRFWDVNTGQEIAQFISFTDGEWIVITPEGYFNASPNGAKHLNVRLGNNVYSIDNFYSRFYRPELVQLALAGKQLPKGESIGEIIAKKPAPSVRILLPDTGAVVDKESIDIAIKAVDNGGGIGDINVYLNGSQVANDTRGIAIKGKGAIKEKVLSFGVPLLEGENEIRVIAFNSEGSMESMPAIITITSKAVSEKPNIYAIVAGINEYRNKNISLRYAVPDAKAFAEILKEVARPPLFENVHIKLLSTLDETTKESIQRAFDGIRKKIRPNDIFVFYNASHGVIDIVDETEQYYLLTSNVLLLSSRHIGRDAMSQKELIQLIGTIPAQKKLIILDTCHAGKAGKEIAIALLQQTRGLTESTAIKLLQRAVGSAVFSAASDTQQALEGYKGHGLFTYAIIEGLKGGADLNKDGYIKISELQDYVEEKVVTLSEQVFNRQQIPTIQTGANFPIGRIK